MMAFQALAVIGAQTAAAVVTCTFASGVITVNTDADDTVEVQQDDASGTIMVGELVPAPCTPVAPIATTTAIVINGDVGDEAVTIDMYETAGATIDWGTVNWTVDLGSDALDNDAVDVNNSGGDDSVDVVAGASGIDLNNDGNLDVTMSGVEDLSLTGGIEDDTLSAGGSTATGAAVSTDVVISGDSGDDTVTGGSGNDDLFGDDGDDTIAGGLGDDLIDGGGDEDTADFSASTTAVNANLTTGNATGQGLDTLTAIEDLVGSALGDTLTGGDGDNFITGGAGDDKIDGKDLLGVDTADYSDSAAAVTVDLDAGTATGNGNDTLTAIEDVQGSDFADTLGGDDGSNGLFGGSGTDTIAGLGGDDDLEGEGGVDTVDYSWSASPVDVKFSCSAAAGTGTIGGTTNPTDDVVFTMENAILTTDDDTFAGNQFANRVWPNGGQNSLDGDLGLGGCVVGGGGDTLDYSVGYTTGVNVNMAGGATAGDSAVNFENAIGTAFRDTIVGNASSNTVQGRAGKDNLKGGSGDDVLRGAKGNDIVRGGSGDDDMFGGPGKKDRGFGGSGTDLCRGFEFRRGCELK